jgi:type IV secretory pathway TrbD component
MPDFCTCGAQLPPDALFCHKCGKPQREIITPETHEPSPAPSIEEFAPAPLPAPAAAVRPEAQPPSFRNPTAVRVALIVAVSATVLSMTALPLVSWPLAGFFAVFLYRRRTGSSINVGAGARLGMITGVLMAAMSTVVVSLFWLPAAFSGRLGTLMQEQMKNFPGRDPMAMQQMMRSLSGPDMAFALLFGLIGVFVLITGLSMAGGALGAKLVGRSQS